MPNAAPIKTFLHRLSLCVAFLLATCAGLTQGHPTEASSAIEAETCLAVNGPRILASDLAPQDARFLSLPHDADLGYAPDPGAVRWIAPPRFAGDRACVVRQQQPLRAEQVMEALALSDLGNVEADLVSWTADPLPNGHLHMPLGGIVAPARGTNEVLWRGALEYDRDASGKGRSLPVWARVRLSRQEPCLRLLRAQRRGQTLDFSATEAAPCDAAAIIAAALSPSAAKGNWRIASDLPAGAWLLENHRTRAPVLQRGEKATLSVTSGGVSLALPVIAEQAGALGQSIWVRSVADRKRFQATIIGPHRLEVRAGPSTAANSALHSSRPTATSAFQGTSAAPSQRPAARQRIPF